MENINFEAASETALARLASFLNLFLMLLLKWI